MNNEQLAPKVRAWLKSTDVGPEDVRRSVGIMSSRAEHTRQRGRWWPLPSIRRRTESQAARTDYQPSPIPASNGQTPTVIGRTTSMLSSVKAITAGALVFAIGGAFLIAQPFEQQGSVPGAEAVVAVAPAWVTATVQFSPNCDFGVTTTTEDGVRQERGMNCQGQTWTSVDHRLDGRANVAQNADSFKVDEQSYSLVSSAIEVITDEGGWRCTNADRMASPAGTVRWTGIFEGERFGCVGYGENDGFSAILVTDFVSSPKTVEGLIFPGAMPPMPEFPSSE